MQKPTVAETQPIAVEVEAGKVYWWCACGRSKKQPFCDGSHSGTGITPVMYECTESKELWFCGCKATGNKPFCDGTHAKL